MKIAVVGGGIYGVSVALRLATQGYEVSLYEKNKDILLAASGINQYRLHRGYHYPRSADTIESCRDTISEFIDEYKEAIVSHYDHYYCIAKEKSLVSGNDFLKVCESNGLEYEISILDVVNNEKLDVTIRARESLFDAKKLRAICWERLKTSGVNVYLNTEAKADIFDAYDVVVVATYANMNDVLERFPEAQQNYQYELCEKPVFRMPPELKGKSIVIMDGPFMCIDPIDSGEYSVMGNVVHAIHSTNTGKKPVIPEGYRDLINNGIIKSPPITNVKKFVDSASEFIPAVRKAEYIGSMYTVRTVLPNEDDTDRRPTVIRLINNKLITVFSGKIGNAVHAAHEVSQLIAGIDEDRKKKNTH